MMEDNYLAAKLKEKLFHWFKKFLGRCSWIMTFHNNAVTCILYETNNAQWRASINILYGILHIYNIFKLISKYFIKIQNGHTRIIYIYFISMNLNKIYPNYFLLIRTQLKMAQDLRKQELQNCAIVWCTSKLVSHVLQPSTLWSNLTTCP